VQGRLFPRETALLQLLEQVNDYEIEPLWAEDETIGWIYQYFNSQEERKKMRSESSAPRNSRELAVRNQFFTPRYVVEFLTDNTLGRIWYEMTKGNTALADSCQYLVKRPNEVFLSSGESSPAENESKLDETTEKLTQQELLDQTVYIPHRPLKDPRTIRMLDPACGSMHFGLYAFDLFERIYIEAWQVEAEKGADALEREADLLPLHQAFGDLAHFKQQIPKLIIEHNIHGVDIDPRAVQIAGLSLWQRAQRAWHEQGIKPNQRPTIVKSNIVCAEPMPGEQDLLKEFTSTLNPPALGQLVEVIFDKMALAGEAGTLLKIEQEIETAISKARQQWDKSRDSGTQDLFEEELLAATPQQQLGFDLSGIDDESFWEDAEQLILQALQDYSEKATSASGEKRLFAEDTAKGFAFIDLSRKRFDVVLMNPPFGEYSKLFKNYSKIEYNSGGHDILTAFVERGLFLLNKNGLLGSITSRTPFYAPTTVSWRQNSILNTQINIWADLGEGILDDAMVETCAYTLKKSKPTRKSVFLDNKRLIEEIKNKELSLLQLDSVRIINQESLDLIKGSPFAYWVRPSLLKVIANNPPLSDKGINVSVGLQTGNDFRFIRTWWEVEDKGKNDWLEHAKGGENQPFFVDVFLKVNWKDDGAEIKSTKSCRLNAYTTVNPIEITESGLTFPYRTHRFSPAIIKPGVVTGVAGMGIISSTIDIEALSSFLNSSIVNEIIKTRLSRKELAPLYQAGTISPTPIPKISKVSEKILIDYSRVIKNNIEFYFSFDETTINYRSLFKSIHKMKIDRVEAINSYWESCRTEIFYTFRKIDMLVAELFGITLDEGVSIYEDNIIDFKSVIPNTLLNYQELLFASISHQVGSLFGRWKNETLAIKEDGIATTDMLIESLMHANDLHIQELKKELMSIDIDFFDKPMNFFAQHLKMYSKGRRQAPIYWPLQTSSGSYTLWVYYHLLNTQTLYSCVNDFVEPKLASVTEDLNTLSNKSNRSSSEEKELTKLTDLQSELKDFRDELLRLAKIWKPNLNDGVQITAAPLWKLFQHTAWQKKLKQTWEKLEEGEYDWAHLAASIWPDRVLRKCHQDRSLAIAHDVEDIFWHEVEVPVMRRKKPTGKTKLEWQPIPASETELDNMVDVAKIRLNKG